MVSAVECNQTGVVVPRPQEKSPATPGWMSDNRRCLKLGCLDSNQEQKNRNRAGWLTCCCPQIPRDLAEVGHRILLSLRADTGCFWHFSRVYGTQSDTRGATPKMLHPTLDSSPRTDVAQGAPARYPHCGRGLGLGTPSRSIADVAIRSSLIELRVMIFATQSNLNLTPRILSRHQSGPDCSALLTGCGFGCRLKT